MDLEELEEAIFQLHYWLICGGVLTDSELLKNVAKFSRQDLEVACEDFSNIIGSSPDSFVYKGTIRGGPEIAVISFCIKEENWTGFLELYYQREVMYFCIFCFQETRTK